MGSATIHEKPQSKKFLRKKMSHRTDLMHVFEYHRCILNNRLFQQNSDVSVVNISCHKIRDFDSMVDIAITYMWRDESTILLYPIEESKLEFVQDIDEYFNGTILDDMDKNVRHFLPFIMSLCFCGKPTSKRNIRAWISYSDDQVLSIVIQKKKRSKNKCKNTSRDFRFNRTEFLDAYALKNSNYFKKIFKYCHQDGQTVMRSFSL